LTLYESVVIIEETRP